MEPMKDLRQYMTHLWEETDYAMWVNYLHQIWEKQNFQPKLIADLRLWYRKCYTNISKTRI